MEIRFENLMKRRFAHGLNHFCTFQYFDGFKGAVREQSEIYVDLKRKILKLVVADNTQKQDTIIDYRIVRFREDKNAWYFWLKDFSLTSVSNDEFFGLGVTKDGTDFWGQLKIGKYLPTYFKVETSSLH